MSYKPENKSGSTPVLSRKTKLITILCVAPTVAVSMWMTHSEIWPVSKLIEWQAMVFHGYYFPKYTGFITFLCLLFIQLFGVLLIVRVTMGVIERVKFGSNSEENADGKTSVTVRRAPNQFLRLFSVGVFLDGKQVGVVRAGKSQKFAIHPGTRTMHIKIRRFQSDPVTFALAPGDMVWMQTGFSTAIQKPNAPANALYLRVAE